MQSHGIGRVDAQAVGAEHEYQSRAFIADFIAVFGGFYGFAAEAASGLFDVAAGIDVDGKLIVGLATHGNHHPIVALCALGVAFAGIAAVKRSVGCGARRGVLAGSQCGERAQKKGGAFDELGHCRFPFYGWNGFAHWRRAE